jgi:hypothetical protein
MMTRSVLETPPDPIPLLGNGEDWISVVILIVRMSHVVIGNTKESSSITFSTPIFDTAVDRY